VTKPFQFDRPPVSWAGCVKLPQRGRSGSARAQGHMRAVLP
jgi:hypothetical protein